MSEISNLLVTEYAGFRQFNQICIFYRYLHGVPPHLGQFTLITCKVTNNLRDLHVYVGIVIVNEYSKCGISIQILGKHDFCTTHQHKVILIKSII